MTLPSTAILQALLTITKNPALLNSLPAQGPLSVPVSAAGIVSYQEFQGTFKPVNNSLVIASGLSLVSPNFLALIVDGLVNLTSDNGMFVKVPVSKVFFAALTPIVGGTSPIGSLTLDGAAANPYPMAQNVAVDYTLILGQATLS